MSESRQPELGNEYAVILQVQQVIGEPMRNCSRVAFLASLVEHPQSTRYVFKILHLYAFYLLVV